MLHQHEMTTNHSVAELAKTMHIAVFSDLTYNYGYFTGTPVQCQSTHEWLSIIWEMYPVFAHLPSIVWKLVDI